MNKLQFHRFCSGFEFKFDPGFRAVEGAVRMNSNESLKHFLKKAEICFRIKRMMPVKAVDMILCEEDAPKWYSPRVYVEVHLAGKNIADLIALTLSGAYRVEIIESENEGSIKAKERSANNMGFKFLEVR